MFYSILSYLIFSSILLYDNFEAHTLVQNVHFNIYIYIISGVEFIQHDFISFHHLYMNWNIFTKLLYLFVNFFNLCETTLNNTYC
jgi:hypothetical protein